MSGWLDRFRRSKDAVASSSARDDPSPTIAAALPPELAWQPRVDIRALFCLRMLSVVATPSASPDERALLAALDGLQQGDVASLVPRVPAVVPQLLRSLRDAHSSTAELAREVSQDPVLVAAVVKAANSPYFGLSKPVASIEQALLVLGHDTLRQLVARVAFKPILSLQSGAFTRIGAPVVWNACERFGDATHVLAPALRANGFEAFLAGVLQDAGAIVALRALDRAAARPARLSLAFAHAFDERTRALATTIGTQWTFPQSVVRAVAEQRMASVSSVDSTPLGRFVATCDRLAKARTLVDAGDIVPDALALGDAGSLFECFQRLGGAPSVD